MPGRRRRSAEPRGIVCGAHNFAAGDLVVVALPGAVLPGGFAITARKTYGHVSDGMICSARELGIGDDHDGILVLPADAAKPGDDALDVLGLRDAVLDIAVTTDRGYCLSIRGLAREAAAALGVAVPRRRRRRCPQPDGAAYEVHVDDPVGCDRFSARAVTGLDPRAADAGLDASAAAPVRHAPDLARRRRHELRDARDRAAAARLRPRQADRARSACAARGRGRS